jgi:hypothetical protein
LCKHFARSNQINIIKSSHVLHTTCLLHKAARN